MNVKVMDYKKTQEVKSGDVIEFKRSKEKFDYYIICESKCDGFFIMNINGQKTKLKFYHTIFDLLSNQSNVNKIYSKEEYEVVIARIQDKL